MKISKNKDRDDEVYRLRLKGKTFSEIASLFNISNSRASQIFKKKEYEREALKNLPPFQKELSERTKTVLRNYFKDQDILDSPKDIADLGCLDILRIKNIGIKSAKEIANALHAIGLIDSQDDWLQRNRW